MRLFLSELEVSLFPSVAVGEAQSSVSAAEDLQTYSEREWKGNTTKSQLIRKVSLLLSYITVCLLKEPLTCASVFRVMKQ